MNAWLLHHFHSARLAWRSLASSPLTSLLSLVAIGVALALPAGGQMLLSGARQLAGSAAATPQISLFLRLDADRTASNELRTRLERHPGVAQYRFLPREETLARMKAGQGLREVIEALPGNPFPDAFVVGVRDDSPRAMESLAAEMRKWQGVEHVQLDSAWVRRLDALLRLGRNALLLMAAVLGCGLVAISFSIIRLQVLARRSEIDLSRLLGATDAYVRRPFLYQGALLGLGGGIVAWLLVAGATLWMQAPLATLAGLYQLRLELALPGLADSALVLGGAAGLGWLGALVSVISEHGD
jgi:cell division transport system permease protein